MCDDKQNIFLTPKEAAEFLRLKPDTLYRWRWQGKGPAYSKVGQRVLYRQSALERYVRRNQVCPANNSQPTEV